jgi:tetratricopeptide (TPR) repeat protein
MQHVPTYRDQLVQALRAKLERPLVEVILDLTGEGTPDARLAHAVEVAEPETVVFVYNLESVLPSDDSSRRERTLHALNWRRNAYVRLQRPLVFWLPEYALTSLAREAPDFFAWHSGLYEFDVPESLYPRLAFETLQLVGKDTIALINLSAEEKRRWMSVLEGLAAEPQRDTEIDKQARASIFFQLGQLLYTLGRYDEARHWLNQALEINRALQHAAGEAATLHQLGMIHQERGEYEAALEQYQRSLTIAEELGDRSGVAKSRGQIGKLCVETGRYPDAFEHLLFALAIFLELQSPDARIAVNTLKDLRAKWGEKEFNAAWQKATGEAVPEWLK